MSVAVRAMPGARSGWQAFGTAFAIEAIGIGSLIAWWALNPAEPPLKPLPLTIEAPPVVAPTPEPPAPPPPQPQAPQPQHVRVAPSPAPQRQVTPVPTPEPAPAPVLAPQAPPVPAAAAIPVAAPPPPPAPPAPAAPSGPPAEYVARVHAAVQSAFVYPAAAAATGFRGRTRVAFTLHGVTPQGARVLVGSGMNMVDRAALQSVQNASYPPPPPELKGADTSFEVWVEFKP